jgi:hypothetical protein
MHADEMEKMLKYVWDPNEFKSEYGIRSVSKFHEKNPFAFQNQSVRYEPGESLEKIKGGNSNWRGPIWFPTNYLFIDSLRRLSEAFQKSLKVQVGEEDPVDLLSMANAFSKGLIQLFTKDHQGHRPIYRNWEKFLNDPHFSDHLLFFEHYHGDNGRGLGANHQTGWSGLVANLIHELYP